jgi:NADH:ubiquinone oxidoreductase subunit H
MTWLENNIFAILDNPATKWLLLVMGLVMPLASLLTWAERRQSAMMQDRLGPNRANIWKIKLKGILHFVADALKMISKEDFVPGSVHRGLFALAPILAIAPVLIAFAIIRSGRRSSRTATPTPSTPWRWPPTPTTSRSSTRSACRWPRSTTASCSTSRC